ncbi:hypothetical protein D3C87_1559410 [compost metagenome]
MWRKLWVLSIQETIQISVQSGCRLITKAAIFRQSFRYDTLKLWWHRRIDFSDGWNLGFTHFAQDRSFTASREETVIRKQFPNHDTKREDIRAQVDVLTVCLLRTHVTKFTFKSSGLGCFQLIFSFRDTEVDDLHFTFKADHDVLGTHVTVINIQRLASCSIDTAVRMI